ncbi:HNH endonuclease family protein [Streptomyces sp. HPF1205]|uniref:HNH endonuclease family protein n=1 Tax=Streptomyces sp. HPF1205 TaxID=2873262 RepID=UPI0027DF5F08|nr:HNH endonuclease family protein [Streptomyces sp. HPF1205]
MVPLAEAWDSGAYGWTARRRELYANDLGYPRSLVAVTARSNRSKADQDVAEWMPPAEDARCQYLDDWVSVKTRWALSVDGAEHRALQELAEACPDTMLDVPIA